MLKTNSTEKEWEIRKSTPKSRFFSVSKRLPLTIFLNLKIKSTRPTRLHLSSSDTSRMLRVKMRLSRITSLNLSNALLSIFLWRMTQLTSVWLNSSTTTQRDRDWRLCSCAKAKAFTSSVLSALPSALKRTRSTSVSEEGTFQSMNSLTSTLPLNWRDLREKTHLRSSLRRSQFKRPLSAKKSVKIHPFVARLCVETLPQADTPPPTKDETSYHNNLSTIL